MYNRSHKLRLSLFLLLPIFLFIFLLARLYYLQVVKFNNFSKIALSQQVVTVKLPPQRGVIYDRKMKEMAISLKVYSAWANPRVIENKIDVAGKVSAALSLDPRVALKKLNKDKSFIWLKRMLSDSQ
ncbi:MAG: hypothetical protein U9R31_02785, partial [Candidatus Omnitrophota bacterium]|nr:hypothetical protein [Candidatus Omnitrophota bacterium]